MEKEVLKDRELLAEYVADDSEDAFRELLERHREMVYAACLRQLGDHRMAQDASQAAFLVLARKAPQIGGKVVIAGWLYRTARYVALTMKREEEARRRRERQAAIIMEGELHKKEASWEELKPYLDESLDSLSHRLRDAVILYYLEGESQREVALELGCTEKAVEMRIAHALEKLRGRLVKKGVVLSVGALTGFLTTKVVEAAPVGLVATCHAAAMAGTAGEVAAFSTVDLLAKGAMRMMMWAKIKVATTCVATALVVGGVGTPVAMKVLAQGEEKLEVQPAKQGKKKAKPVYQMYCINPNRTCEVEHAVGLDNPKEKWRVLIPGKGPSELSYAIMYWDGVVYATSGEYSTALYGVDINTGKIVYKLSGITGSPHLDPAAGIMYASRMDKFIALKVKEKKIIWEQPQVKYESYGSTRAAPVVADGVLVDGQKKNVVGIAAHSCFWLMEKETGKILWELKEPKDRVWWTPKPIIHEGKVFLVSLESLRPEKRDKWKNGWRPKSLYWWWEKTCDVDMYCFDLNTKKIVWEHRIGNLVVSWPVLKDGVLYVNSGHKGRGEKRLFHALDASTGKQLWEVDISKYCRWQNHSVGISGNVALMGGWGNYLVAVDLKEKKIKWVYHGIEQTAFCQFCIVKNEGRVYLGVAYQGGERPGTPFYCFDLETGKVIWRTIVKTSTARFGHISVGQPIVVDGKMVVGNRAAGLICLEGDPPK